MSDRSIRVSHHNPYPVGHLKYGALNVLADYKCTRCEAVFPSLNPNAEYCEVCRKERKRERERAYYQARKRGGS